jgi:hypothetical protein
VQSGFSWPALFLGSFWAVAKRRWWLLLLMLAMDACLWFGSQYATACASARDAADGRRGAQLPAGAGLVWQPLAGSLAAQPWLPPVMHRQLMPLTQIFPILTLAKGKPSSQNFLRSLAHL